MTHVIKVKSGNKFEEIGSYSRIVAVGDWIYVSNTAGRNSKTGEMPDDVGEQTQQIFANVEAALQAVDSTLADVIAARVFVPDPADMPRVMEIFAETFREVDPVLTATSPALGAPIYKVEIELTAYRGASAAEVEYRRVVS
jgi:enamine deaminase RidA (YjgF/YER057c/UK114 family)